MPKLSRAQISLGVIVILHTVGTTGMLIAKDWFVPLTPLNLMVSSYFVLRHAEQPRWGVYALIALLSFGIEAVGVATGWPFGNYEYVTALGPQLIRTPILIGLLWLLLLSGALYWMNRLTTNRVLQALGAAALMTGIDVLIEPVAIALQYWTWYGADVPLTNYLGWFGTALVLATIANAFDPQFRTNRLAGLFFIVQIVFFFTLNIFTQW